MEIGRGKSGKVYLCEDGMAHKVFEDSRRYHKEKNNVILERNIKHSCKLHSCNDDTKTLVFEYIPHVLEDVLNMPINKLDILTQLGEFLVDANNNNVVHGDFKAKNIMVYKDLKTIRVIDFETARKSKNNAEDIKKFKFLAIQVIFGVSYKDSYTKYKMYVGKSNVAQFFEAKNIKDMVLYIPNLC
jgi:tRNA A-37 threonylcarbamoyl transferase component Bud32